MTEGYVQPVRSVCFGCFGPITWKALPCPTPGCSRGFEGPVYLQPMNAPPTAWYRMSSDVPQNAPALSVRRWLRVPGYVRFPDDWEVPGRASFVWVDEEALSKQSNP